MTDAKIRLAKEYVCMYHGKEAAELAEQHFSAVFRNRSFPEHIDEFRISQNLMEDGCIQVCKLLVTLGFASSNSEARRSVVQGAVKLNGARISDPYVRIELHSGDIMQSGKRKFAKIVISEGGMDTY